MGYLNTFKVLKRAVSFLKHDAMQCELIINALIRHKPLRYWYIGLA